MSASMLVEASMSYSPKPKTKQSSLLWTGTGATGSPAQGQATAAYQCNRLDVPDKETCEDYISIDWSDKITVESVSYIF